MNILVTGAQGFIGTNLVKQLSKIEDVTIFEFNRDNSLDDLKNIMGSIDFIYHLAGEVRPKSSDEEFQKSNANLTKNIIDIIESKNKKIPLVMASSIHAKFQKNAYGITKREAEIALEEYAKRNSTPVWIYRLPHVFGEGCKPNYNSVISTWMYNSIRDKEIVVFDREIPMTYVYVQDVVHELVEMLNFNKQETNSEYIEPKVTYETTLGEVVNFITEFKDRKEDGYIYNDAFRNKLFITYLDYLNEKNV
jgi:UDP-2-acetamido-2,6-beta-L-arabino-hexul-4-ose reductase